MIFVAFNIVFLLLVFTGIGLLFPWSVFRREPRLDGLLLAFWAGWSLAVAFLQVWHFFFALQLAAFVLLLAAGAAGWWRARALVGEMVRGWKRPQALVLAGLALVPAAMLANHVLFSEPNSDYALYHLPTILWYQQYAIVPGLGNLYHPLAWNCSSFLYSAAINNGWLAERAYYLSNTLPAYALLLQCAAGLYGLFTRRPLRAGDLFYALMSPVILMQASTAYLTAYSPDPLIFFMQIVIAGQMVALFDDARRSEGGLGLFQNRAAEMVLLAAAGVCVKLSFAVFGALSLLVMAAIGIARFGAWPWRMPRLWLGWLALGLALVLPWMGRSVVLSGYLIFPNTAIALPVDWKIPPLIADAAQPVIIAWARTVNGSIEYTGDWTWFLAWFRAFPFFAKQAFFIGLGLLALDGLAWLLLRPLVRRAPAREEDAPHQPRGFTGWDPGLVLALTIFPSLVFWFVMGPSYRFSGALFWLLLAAGLMIAYHLLARAPLAARPEVAALCLVLGFSLWLSPNHFSNNLSRRLVFLPPAERTLNAQAMPREGVRQRTTASGLVVNIPPTGVEECRDAPLPCTTEANFMTGLRERVPGDPQQGYVLILK